MTSFDVLDPQEGYFEMPERKGGRLVAVRIWLEDGDRDERGDLMSDQLWMCLVDGVEQDPWKVWSWAARRPIDKAGYDYRLARSAHDIGRGVRPGEPIDLMTAKPAF